LQPARGVRSEMLLSDRSRLVRAVSPSRPDRVDRLHPARFREVSLPRLPTRGLGRNHAAGQIQGGELRHLGEKAQVQVLLSLDDQGRQTGEIR